MQKIIRVICMPALIGLMFFSGVIEARAALNNFGFDDSLKYDIYFTSGEDTVSVVKSIQILEVRDVAGRKFLVVKSQGFKLKPEDGFILFDAIVAIFPDRNFDVKGIDKIHVTLPR